MLILNIVGCDTRKRNKIIPRRRCSFKPIERRNVYIDRKLFHIITVSDKQILNGDLDHLLKMYRGRVLRTRNEVINGYINEYIYNPSAYYKRAFLSSILNIVNENEGVSSVSLNDSSFTEYPEYCALASVLRRFSVKSESDELDSFCKKCYEQYGLSVTRYYSRCNEYDIEVDFDEMKNEKTMIIRFLGKPSVIHLDPSYFNTCDELSIITDELVPFYDMRSALAEIP